LQTVVDTERVRTECAFVLRHGLDHLVVQVRREGRRRRGRELRRGGEEEV
jgi:hypothetical protein